VMISLLRFIILCLRLGCQFALSGGRYQRGVYPTVNAEVVSLEAIGTTNRELTVIALNLAGSPIADSLFRCRRTTPLPERVARFAEFTNPLSIFPRASIGRFALGGGIYLPSDKGFTQSTP
jgi:hypothetical protein